jgi:hypothetical protein
VGCKVEMGGQLECRISMTRRCDTISGPVLLFSVENLGRDGTFGCYSDSEQRQVVSDILACLPASHLLSVTRAKQSRASSNRTSKAQIVQY